MTLYTYHRLHVLPHSLKREMLKRHNRKKKKISKSELFWYQKVPHILLEYSPSNGTLFFGNNIKSKMRILYLIGNVYLNQKTLIKNIFGSLHAFS